MIQTNQERGLGIAALISLLGLVIHNTAEFDVWFNLQMNSGFFPMAIVMASLLVLGTMVKQSRSFVRWALFGLAILNLFGAIFTILPLTVLPFAPAQTFGHYVAHVIYGLCQLPLFLFTLRRRPT